MASREEELLLQESCELMRIHPGPQRGRVGGGGEEGGVAVDKNSSFAAGPLPHLLLQ